MMVEKWMDLFEIDHHKVNIQLDIQNLPAGILLRHGRTTISSENDADIIKAKIRLTQPISENVIMHELLHIKLHFLTGLDKKYNIINLSEFNFDKKIEEALIRIYAYLQEYVVDLYTLEIAQELSYEGKEYGLFLGDRYSHKYCLNTVKSTISIYNDDLSGLDKLVGNFILGKNTIYRPLFQYQVISSSSLLKDVKLLPKKLSKSKNKILQSLAPFISGDVFNQLAFSRLYCRFLNAFSSLQLKTDSDVFKVVDNKINPSSAILNCLKDLNLLISKFDNIIERLNFENLFDEAIVEHPESDHPYHFVHLKVLEQENINDESDNVLTQLLYSKLTDEFFDNHVLKIVALRNYNV